MWARPSAPFAHRHLCGRISKRFNICRVQIKGFLQITRRMARPHSSPHCCVCLCRCETKAGQTCSRIFRSTDVRFLRFCSSTAGATGMADQSRIDRFPQRRDDTNFINYISSSPIKPHLPSGPVEADLWAALQSRRLSVRPRRKQACLLLFGIMSMEMLY